MAGLKWLLTLVRLLDIFVKLWGDFVNVHGSIYLTHPRGSHTLTG